MAQLFSPAANVVFRVSLLLVVIGVAGVAIAAYLLMRSSYFTRVDLVHEQPVPFSHRHHVEGLGLDCRYCHTSVEDSSFAGIPSTSICMNCHTQIWADSPMLEPVRQSYYQQQPLRWTRVHDMPDYVYFNHAIHVNKGIGCVTCHGRVDQMALTKKTRPMYMNWCLDCHRDPHSQLRPSNQIFNMVSNVESSSERQERLMQQYDIRQTGMTDCNTCHR